MLVVVVVIVVVVVGAAAAAAAAVVAVIVVVAVVLLVLITVPVSFCTAAAATATATAATTTTRPTSFNGLFSRTTWVSQHQKGKPFWILLDKQMIGWQWHQLDHMQFFLYSYTLKFHRQCFLLILQKDKQTQDVRLPLAGSGKTKIATNARTLKAPVASNCIYFKKKILMRPVRHHSLPKFFTLSAKWRFGLTVAFCSQSTNLLYIWPSR